MWTRSQCKSNAKLSFRRFYWIAVLASLIVVWVSGNSSGVSLSSDTEFSEWYQKLQEIISQGNFSLQWDAVKSTLLTIISTAGIFALVLHIFVGNPLLVGCKRIFMIGRSYRPAIRELFYAFTSGRYGNIVKIMFLRDLYTFLWGLLFIIPGIVKSYEYRMIPFYLAEDATLDRSLAFEMTRNMMNGQKWDVFVLDLSFWGWHFLSGLTSGILGIFYVNPYVNATETELYIATKTAHPEYNSVLYTFFW